MTRGSETASQIKVRFEGVCDQPLEAERRVTSAVEGELSRGESLPLVVGEGEVGDVGSGKSDGCLRVDTMMARVAQSTRL